MASKASSENNTPSTAEPSTFEGGQFATPSKPKIEPQSTTPVVADEYAEFCKTRFNELVMGNPELAGDQNKLAQILAMEWSQKLATNAIGGTAIITQQPQINGLPQF